jgi:WD40 repeat protein
VIVIAVACAVLVAAGVVAFELTRPAPSAGVGIVPYTGTASPAATASPTSGPVTVTPIATFTDPDSGGVHPVAFGAGATLAVGDVNDNTYLWDTDDPGQPVPLKDIGGYEVESAAFESGGVILAVGDSNGDTYVWNTSGTPRLIAMLHDTSGKAVESVAWGPDGTLATADSDGTTNLWNTSDTASMAFGADGTLVTGDFNGSAYRWRLKL